MAARMEFSSARSKTTNSAWNWAWDGGTRSRPTILYFGANAEINEDPKRPLLPVMTTTSFSWTSLVGSFPMYCSIQLLVFTVSGVPKAESQTVKTESSMKFLDHIRGKFTAIGPLRSGPRNPRNQEGMKRSLPFRLRNFIFSPE